MRSFIAKPVALLFCLGLAIAGCGGGGGSDSTKPVSTTGGQDKVLIGIYCQEPDAPEAKQPRCTRLAQMASICKQDTPAKQHAITDYIKKTRDYGVCD